MAADKTPRLIVVQFHSGERRRIEAPPGARVTFSKMIPTHDRMGGGGEPESGMIRIYSGTTQLAAFPGVRAFYDMSSIRIERIVARPDGTTVWEYDDPTEISDAITDILAGNASKKQRARDSAIAMITASWLPPPYLSATVAALEDLHRVYDDVLQKAPGVNPE